MSEKKNIVFRSPYDFTLVPDKVLDTKTKANFDNYRETQTLVEDFLFRGIPLGSASESMYDVEQELDSKGKIIGGELSDDKFDTLSNNVPFAVRDIFHNQKIDRIESERIIKETENVVEQARLSSKNAKKQRKNAKNVTRSPVQTTTEVKNDSVQVSSDA